MDRFDFLKLKANELPPLETGEVEICIQDRVGLYHGYAASQDDLLFF